MKVKLVWIGQEFEGYREDKGKGKKVTWKTTPANHLLNFKLPERSDGKNAIIKRKKQMKFIPFKKERFVQAK